MRLLSTSRFQMTAQHRASGCPHLDARREPHQPVLDAPHALQVGRAHLEAQHNIKACRLCSRLSPAQVDLFAHDNDKLDTSQQVQCFATERKISSHAGAVGLLGPLGAVWPRCTFAVSSSRAGCADASRSMACRSSVVATCRSAPPRAHPCTSEKYGKASSEPPALEQTVFATALCMLTSC